MHEGCLFDDGYFSKKPWTQFSGASRHIASQNSQYFKPQTNTSTFTLWNAGKKGWKKKKMCAPHTLPHSWVACDLRGIGGAHIFLVEVEIRCTI